MSRFSTTDGAFVGWRNLPKAVVSICQAVVRKTTGHIPRGPWIPFSARAALTKILRPDWQVWEIGAGFSTLWLSPRIGHLVSIEASKVWYDRLRAVIEAEAISNVDLRYEWVADRMVDFSTAPDGSLDLLFIDGGPRGLSLERGFAKVRAGGYLYLDNWDTKEFWGTAEEFLGQHAEKIDFRRSFIDYVPAQFGVFEGLLIRKRAAPASAID